MIIKTAEFVKSCASQKDYEGFSMPFIAIAGKSNVGKSSFINMLTGSAKLAKVSKEAGRTRLINLFSINGGEFMLADLPGWGYSAAGKALTGDFGALVENFLMSVPNLAHIFMLVDIRHEPQDADRQMLGFMHRYQIPFTIIAVKSDKLSGAKLNPHIGMVAAGLRLGRDDIIPVSNLNKSGRDKILKKIEQIISSFYESSAQPQPDND